MGSERKTPTSMFSLQSSVYPGTYIPHLMPSFCVLSLMSSAQHRYLFKQVSKYKVSVFSLQSTLMIDTICRHLFLFTLSPIDIYKLYIFISRIKKYDLSNMDMNINYELWIFCLWSSVYPYLHILTIAMSFLVFSLQSTLDLDTIINYYLCIWIFHISIMNYEFSVFSLPFTLIHHLLLCHFQSSVFSLPSSDTSSLAM